MNHRYRAALGLLLPCAAYAQTATPAAQSPLKQRIHLTNKSAIIDASGAPVPYAVWRPMLTQGDYKLLPAPGSSVEAPVYRIVARTAAEHGAYLAPLPPPQASPFFTTGHALAPFKLRDLKGRTYSSKELAGKIVVLNFWFIGCPPCRQEIPDLNKLVQQNAKRDDIVFLAVALDAQPAIEEFVQQHPYNYALVADGRSLAAGYGISSFPTNLVVDRQGKVVFHAQIHPDMASYLQKAIDEAK